MVFAIAGTAHHVLKIHHLVCSLYQQQTFFVRATVNFLSAVMEAISTCDILVISILSLWEEKLEFKVGNLGSFLDTSRDGTSPSSPLLSFVTLIATLKMVLGLADR